MNFLGKWVFSEHVCMLLSVTGPD